MGEMWRTLGKPLHWPSAESWLRGDPPVDPATLPKPDPANDTVVTNVDHERGRITLCSRAACHAKQAFDSRGDANRAARRLGAQAFRCRHCRKWHLASGGRRAKT